MFGTTGSGIPNGSSIPPLTDMHCLIVKIIIRIIKLKRTIIKFGRGCRGLFTPLGASTRDSVNRYYAARGISRSKDLTQSLINIKLTTGFRSLSSKSHEVRSGQHPLHCSLHNEDQ